MSNTPGCLGRGLPATVPGMTEDNAGPHANMPTPEGEVRDALMETFRDPGMRHGQMSDLGCHPTSKTGRAELRWSEQATTPPLIVEKYNADVRSARLALLGLQGIEGMFLMALTLCALGFVLNVMAFVLSGSHLWLLLGTVTFLLGPALAKRHKKMDMDGERKELRDALRRAVSQERRHLPLDENVASVVNAALQQDPDAARSAMKLMGEQYPEEIRRRAAGVLLGLESQRNLELEGAQRACAQEGERELAQIEAAVEVAALGPSPEAE